MTLQKGEMVHNRYRILHRMGDTNYRAMDMSLRQACIVKEFTGTTSERITQLASVQHPRLPRIIDLVGNGDQSLLVMDLIEGANLPERMFETDDPTPDEQIWAWLEQLVEILVYLHGQNPPVTHGNISLDTVTIRPNGEAALTDFATHEKEPSVDVHALGYILGYLVTDTHPPQTDQQLLEKLAPLPGRLSQLAQELLKGSVTKAENVLARKNETPDSPETTYLAGALGSPAPDETPAVPQASEPVMPWDKPAEDNPQAGPGTIVWGERVADDQRTADDQKNVDDNFKQPIEFRRPQQPPPVIDSTETIPEPPPTQMVGSHLTQASPIREVPKFQPIREAAATSARPSASQPAAPSAPKAEKKSKGFNWLWIVVGIMAGIILLCLGAVGFVALNWDEIVAEVTPAFSEVDIDPEKEVVEAATAIPEINQPADTDEAENAPAFEDIEEATATPLPAPTEAPAEAPAEDINLPEEDPTEVPEEQVNAPVEENLEANSEENEPASGSAGDNGGSIQGDVYRNDELGYLFVIPEDFVVLSEGNGAVTMGRNIAGADESILMRVFPLAENSSAEQLMSEIEAQVPDTEGIMYGRQPAEFDELSGLYQLSSIFPTEESPNNLISEIYTLQNEEASILVIGTMTAEAEVSAVIFDILPSFLTDLEIFVGTAYGSE